MFHYDYAVNRAFSLENRVQAVNIFLGTCPTVVRSRSTAIVYRSLLVLISFLQDNCSPMVGVQMFLKMWYLEQSCPWVVHTPCYLYSLYRARVRTQAPIVRECLGRAWSSAKLKSTNNFIHTIVQLCRPAKKRTLGYLAFNTGCSMFQLWVLQVTY